MSESFENLKESVKDLAEALSTKNFNLDAEEVQRLAEQDGFDPDYGVPISAWFNDTVLDYYFLVSRELRYKAAKIYTAIGGPSIYIDTEREIVVGAHGPDTFTWGYHDENGIDDFMDEIFEISRE